jgi:hypothetical protein
MRVACFCGHRFESEFDAVACPRCDEVSTVPTVTPADAVQMRADLAALLSRHQSGWTRRHR